MLLNTNKTKALYSGLLIQDCQPPHGDLVLSGVFICASPNLDILGVKFDSKLTFDDNVCGSVAYELRSH